MCEIQSCVTLVSTYFHSISKEGGFPVFSHEQHVTADSDYYVYTPGALARKIFFYPVCTGHFVYEPGYFLQRNSYDSFLLMFITKGACTVTLDGTSSEAHAGDIVLLDCYAPHQYGSETGYESVWLHFDGPLCREYCGHIIRSCGHILTPGSDSSIKHRLLKIYRTFKNADPVDEPDCSKEITCILTELLHCRTKKETAPSAKQSLSDTIAYINEHFSEPLTLDALAASASLSPWYFTRLFTEQTGMTPHRYLIAVRLNAAKFLLKTTSIPVKEIGFSCGFSSESSFCTTFRKWEQVTPGEYRNLI